ncbi:HAMP domain-containing histidine kinase [Oxalobacteraceae bacterium]|nr:HAMP domain-containing histidine kinase [Oxalobacteraceae bacterium]
MRLSTFIDSHIDVILTEWENFAREQEPGATALTKLALGNHAEMILRAIATDLRTVETSAEQYAKSQGLAHNINTSQTAASLYGTLRQTSGFSLLELTAEFRALRATVLRLWMPNIGEMTDVSVQDMVRFNEAVDQTLAESVVTYAAQATTSRDTFMAMLGHDLRGPLSTISMAGSLLQKAELSREQLHGLGARVLRSAATMTALVNDLLEYARSELGGGIPILKSTENIEAVCQLAVEDVCARHPECSFEFEADGNLTGRVDKQRLQQVLSNLFSNAARYRAEGSSVSVYALGEPETISIRVRNPGPVIPESSLRIMFNPMIQLQKIDGDHSHKTGGIGLGLFIAQEIMQAHGGTISAVSNETDGTTFTVTMPR